MIRRSMIFMIALMILMAACAPVDATEDSTAEPILLVDGLGRTVELAEPAQRIVSLT